MSRIRVSGSDIIFDGDIVGHITITDGTTLHADLVESIEFDISSYNEMMGVFVDQAKGLLNEWYEEGDAERSGDKYNDGWHDAIAAVVEEVK